MSIARKATTSPGNKEIYLKFFIGRGHVSDRDVRNLIKGLTDLTQTYNSIREVQQGRVRSPNVHQDALKPVGRDVAAIPQDWIFVATPRASSAVKTMASLSITALPAPECFGAQN